MDLPSISWGEILQLIGDREVKLLQFQKALFEAEQRAQLLGHKLDELINGELEQPATN